MSQSVIFFTSAYRELAHRIAQKNNYMLGDIERNTFPDGERYFRIKTDVRGKSVFLLGGSHSDLATLELYDLGCGLVRSGAQRLCLILPYFGYSTMERAVKRGEVVTAKNRARLFSSIPPSPYGNTLFAIDLHTGGLQYYFEEAIRVFHIYAKDVILEKARAWGGDDFVLASTDSGRAKWVESLANDLGVSASFIFKKRLSGSQTKIQAVSAQVDDKTVIIYDDMIRTGGSLIGAAQAYKNAGARDIFAICTHGVFPKGSLIRLRQSNLFKRIACTDSHPNGMEMHEQHKDFLDLLCLDNVIAKALNSYQETP